MRLIDEEQLVIAGNCRKIDGEFYIKLSDIERCLDNASTAYDVKSVVERLEKQKQLREKELLNMKYKDGFRHAMNRAIEIVKSGGVE